MKHLLLILTVLITLASQGQGNKSPKREKIKTLFALMHQDSLIIKTFDGMSNAMVQNMSAMFNDTAYTNHGIDASKFTQKLVEKNMKRGKEIALKLVSVDMVDIYEKYFTIEEIEDFTAFYKTKSAQKLLAQMPEITKDIMTIMSTKYQKDYQASFMKDIEEIKNELTEQVKAKK
jgi:uncharacterized protein